MQIEYFKGCFSESYKIDGVDLEEYKDLDSLTALISAKIKEKPDLLPQFLSEFLNVFGDIVEDKYEQCGQCGDWNEEILYEL